MPYELNAIVTVADAAIANDRDARPSGQLGSRPLRLLTGAGIAILGLLAGPPTAQAQQVIMSRGDLVVTGFSGVTATSPAPVAGDPADGMFIDPAGAVMRIFDVSGPGQAPQGQVLNAPPTFQVKAGVTGQVFGIAIDDGKGPDGTASGSPSIYLAATSAYGLQIVVPDAGGGPPKRIKTGEAAARWMAGQWGEAAGGGPGSIWKVDGATGAVTLFANVMQDGQANSGAGLGNIAFDPRSRQLFATDLSTGMIHRFDMQGNDLGYFDHGSQGRMAAGLAPVPFDPTSRIDITQPSFRATDPATWHFAPKGRMVWGVKVKGDRLYYSTAEGPQIWSIKLDDDGSFGSDPRPEIDIRGALAENVISGIAFDRDGFIYLAQRGAPRGDYAYKTFAESKTSAVARYAPSPDGRWLPAPQEYAIGFPPENRNPNGGVALGYGYDAGGRMQPGSCDRFVWSTGELLRLGSGLPGPQAVHGLQGLSRDLVRPANTPPLQSYFVEFNPMMEDAAAAAQMGDVAIFQPCSPQQGGIPQGGIPLLNILPAPQPLPLPSFPGNNLTLTKTGGACVARNNAPDFDCNYLIVITNTGAGFYSGPLQVDDLIGTKFGSPTFDPAWLCTPDPGNPQRSHCVLPFVTLAPGESVTLADVMPVQHGDLSSTACQLPNTATLVVPPGGSPANANPLDDTSTAVDFINNPDCMPTTPPGTTGNLTVTKTGADCKPIGNAGDFDCPYTITLKNTGSTAITGPLQIDDVNSAKFGSPQFDPPWTCTFDNATKISHCTLPAATLAPGASVTLTEIMHVAHGDLSSTSCNLVNTVKLVSPPGGTASATDIIKNPNCIPVTPPTTTGPHLKLSKIGDPCTSLGEVVECNFVVTIANTGTTSFSGPIALDDTTSGTLTAQAPWTCTNVSGGKYMCTNPAITIPPSSSEAVNMKVRVNVFGGASCRLENTVKLSGPAASASSPPDDTAKASVLEDAASCGLLTLKKTAISDCTKKASGNFDCGFEIDITNTGPNTLAMTSIQFEDQFVPFISFQASSGTQGPNRLICSVKPGSKDKVALNCGLNWPFPFAPGGVFPLSIHFEVAGSNATPGKCKLLNTATVLNPVGSFVNTTASATGKIPMVVDPVKGTVPCDPPSLKLSKAADPQTCVKAAGGFQCSYKLTLASTGPDPFHGPIDIQETLPAGSSLVKVSSPWTCAGGGTSLQCTHPFIDIPVGQSLDMAVTVLVPDAQVKPGACQILNKATLGLPRDQLSGAQYAASASATIDSPLCALPTQQCPGDLKLVGTQCKCPEHTTRTADNRCTGAAPPPVLVQCQPPQVGIFPNCQLPSCPPGTRGTYPSCVQIAQQCPEGTQGIYPRCIQVVRQCPEGTRGTYPNCVQVVRQCPEGSRGTYPNCVPNVQNCPRNTHGVYPNCVPDGRPTQTPPPVPPSTARACPRFTQGVYPNCVPIARPCPAGTQRGAGGACLPVIR